MFKGYPSQLIEVVDQNNLPLALLSEKEVHRQGLLHRSLVLFLFTSEKKILLRKRNRLEPLSNHFDFFHTHFYPQKSRIDNLKELLKKYELKLPKRIDYLTTVPASINTNLEFIYIYQATVNYKDLPLLSQNIASFSPPELKKQYTLQMLTPLVIEFLAKSWLVFPLN